MTHVPRQTGPWDHVIVTSPPSWTVLSPSVGGWYVRRSQILSTPGEEGWEATNVCPGDCMR